MMKGVLFLILIAFQLTFNVLSFASPAVEVSRLRRIRGNFRPNMVL